MAHQVTLTESQVMEILENMSDAFYSVDENWRLIYMNSQIEAHWNKSREEMLGKRLWDIFPRGVGSFPYQQMLRAAQEKRPVEFENYSTFLDRWLLIRVMPSASGLNVYFQDIHDRKMAELELKPKRVIDAYLAAVVRASGDAIIGLSPEGIIESWNPKANHLFGYAAEEAIGRPKSLLAPAERKEEHAELIARVRAGHMVSAETVRVAKDGHMLNVILNMAPITDGEGQMIGISATMIDITERKKYEEQLAYQASLLNIVTEAIVAFDPQERITYWSPGAEQMYGRPAGEVVGKTSAGILGRPDTPEEEVRKAIRRAAFARGEILRGEDRPIRKDGRPIWVEYNARAFFDAEGKIAGYVTVQRDITARKEAEEALRRSEERYRAVSESGLLAIAFFTTNGEVTMANDSFLELMGYTRAQFNTRRLTWADLTPPEWKARAAQARNEFMATGKITPYEREYFRQDGTRFWGLFGGSRLEQTDEAVAFVVDITKRKRAEDELRRLNEMLGRRVQERTAELTQINRELDEFAYVASHDLKSPLRAIENLAHWIEQDAGYLLPPASQEHLRKLQARIQLMSSLLDDLLAYSRAGRLRHPLERIDVSLLVLDIVEMLAPPPGFRVTIADTVPVFVAERVPLEMALRNLIENAIKHHPNPTQGEAIISVRMVDNWLEFSVTDNGAGIDPQFHKRIFEIFQILKPREQMDGSGVGLTVVKKLVEMRGGIVAVESNVGEGATFRFTWPK